MAWGYGNAPLLLRGFTVTESDNTATEVREGEFAIDAFSRRRTTRWRSQIPLGSTTPVRTLVETGLPVITASGAVEMTRLAAAQAHLAKLESLIGETVSITWHLTSQTAHYTIDDVQVDWQWGAGIIIGGEWSLALTEVPTPAPATPAPTPAPALTGIVDQQMVVGTRVDLTIAANVTLEAGGHYVRVTGLPTPLIFTAPNKITGTPTALTPKMTTATIKLFSPSGTELDSEDMEFTLA